MAKLSTKKSATTGNEFKFYVPKPSLTSASKLAVLQAATAAPPATPSGPATTAGASAGTSGTAAQTAGECIENNFAELAAIDKRYTALGGSHHVVSHADLVRAALECGYGRGSKWTAALALSKSEATELSAYLLSRLHMVTDCLEVSATKAQSVRTFHKRVEASEKGAISFILGGIGTYLAAEKWLKACSDPVDLFLHVGLYTKAISKPKPIISTSASATKSLPDYVAVSKGKKLHLFESKGGSYTGRSERIVGGLKQLSVAPLMGWAGAGPSAVQSLNCVHTGVDAGKPLRVTCIDPPPQRPVDEPTAQEPEAGAFLIAGVTKLLLVLESVEYFRALVTRPAAQQPQVGPEGYDIAFSPLFGGMLVGVPKVFLEHEDAIRKNIAVFLAIREVLDDRAFHKLNADKRAKLFEKRVLKTLGVVDLGEGTSGEGSNGLQAAITVALEHLQTQDAIPKVAIHLKLETLSEKVKRPPIAELEGVPLLYGGAVTTGGLWLKASPDQEFGRG